MDNTTPQVMTFPNLTAHGVDDDAPVSRTAPTAIAYLLDAESESVVRGCFTDLGFLDRQVTHGSIDTAIEQLPSIGWPRFLIVDIGGFGDPMPRINRLAEICSPTTEVIVAGERNDIVLYRDLKAAGVAEYFYKPLIGSLLTRTLAGISSGTKTASGSRGGRLVYLLGVRGGVGTTTVATNLAWHFAEQRERGVVLVDFNLHTGDAALQFDAQPTHALREALDDPHRIDDLFLERGVTSVTPRLSLLAGLEPLSDSLAPSENVILQLLHKVLAHFRYVLIDLPINIALAYPALLQRAATLLLVSDGGIASVREVGRWREYLGANTPDRTVLHVMNKRGADGALPEEEMLRVIPRPEVSIRWSREVMSASTLGTKAVQACGAMRDGVSDLSRQLSGEPSPPAAHLWQRIFG